MAGPTVAVIGGGVSGLAAALRIRDRLPRAHVIMYESTARLGGKLCTGAVAGTRVETGAESFLMRDPAGGDSAAVAMAWRLGLGDSLVHPDTVPPGLFVEGGLHPLPRGTLLGVPSDLSMLDGVVTPAPERDVDGGRPLLADGADVAVGELVRARLGDQVVDRLVDPLLGGVYAGRADRLSLEATVPALARECRAQSTLVGAARAAIATSAAHGGGAPVFATIHSGLSCLVDAMAAALGPVELRFGAPVRELARTAGGWRLVSGPAPAPRTDHVDAVVLAVPARPAGRLLGDIVPAVDYASVGLVTLVLPGPGPGPAPDLPELSGFLVPATEGFAVKAVTLFSRKWRHYRQPVVRASLGRHGEPEILQRGDADLVALVRSELATLLGRTLPAPVGSLVTRWGGALPQYAPGHVARVAAMRSALPRRLAVAGAGFDGVGIPACIRSGTAAADLIVGECLS